MTVQAAVGLSPITGVTDVGKPNNSYDPDGGGAVASLAEMLVMMQKMHMALRDVNRQFAETMSLVGYKQKMAVIEFELGKIEKQYQSSVVRGFSQILEGGFSVVGAVSGSQAMTVGMQGLGKATEGIGGMVAAGIDVEAQKLGVLSEAQRAVMKETTDEIAKLFQRAQDASRDLVQITGQITALQGSLQSAVRLY